MAPRIMLTVVGEMEALAVSLTSRASRAQGAVGEGIKLVSDPSPLVVISLCRMGASYPKRPRREKGH